MSVYLHDIPLPQAQERFRQALEAESLWEILEIEELPLDENVLERILAEPVWAKISSPHYHASAMDGFAIKAEDTYGAQPTSPFTLKIEDQAKYVDTGDPLPDWANAVIPIENVETLDLAGNLTDNPRFGEQIRIRAASTPWRHVRTVGEDFVATQLVLPAGHVLRPVDLGAIAASGHSSVIVSKKPEVAILPTGTELVSIGTEIKKGDIIEFNSIVLAGQIKSWGGIPHRYPITHDDFELICKKVQDAADQYDLVLLNAGSSAGSEDFSSAVVSKLGELLVHGIAVRPGHPVILGMISRSKKSKKPGKKVPIIGVPGYPVSAALTGEVFVEPLLSLWLGNQNSKRAQVTANLTRKITSPAGDDDYLRVIVGKVGEKMLAAPISRGAGVISSMVRADGITVIPRSVQGMEAGTPVKVNLYRSEAELANTIFAIGSHDMTLDLLAQYLNGMGRRLVSANVGSLGGLVALRRGEAHIAGSHLLDPETGEYNLSYINQYLPDEPVKVITWVGREQGLIVKKGNPKGIRDLEDLKRSDIAYINRQRGAGTRVLLDFHLQKLQINFEQIKGYDQEEFTHLGVATAVESNRADCGMAVAAASKALDMGFIPLYKERYDLVIPCKFLENDLLAPLFELMQNVRFKEAVQSMPGYDVSDMGKVVRDC